MDYDILITEAVIHLRRKMNNLNVRFPIEHRNDGSLALICDNSDNIVTSNKPYLTWRVIVEPNDFSSTRQPIDDESNPDKAVSLEHTIIVRIGWRIFKAYKDATEAIAKERGKKLV